MQNSDHHPEECCDAIEAPQIEDDGTIDMGIIESFDIFISEGIILHEYLGYA